MITGLSGITSTDISDAERIPEKWKFIDKTALPESSKYVTK